MLGREEGGLGGCVQRTKEGMRSLSGNVQGREGKRSQRCQRPIDTPTLSPFPTLPLAHSLGGYNIGAEGATALAAILKETQITNLGCAAARVFAFVSMGVDRKANTSRAEAHLRLVIIVSLRTAASAEAPLAPI